MRTQTAPLTIDALAAAKGLPAAWLRSQAGLTDLPGGGVGIPYWDAGGTEIAVKRRTALAARDGSWWPRGVPLAAYGLWRLTAARKAKFLLLVEGETDCWALWHAGQPALGLPGSGTAAALTAEALEGFGKLYVHSEPDKGGEAFAAGVAKRLAALGWTGQAFELRMPGNHKDPADLYAADPAEFLARLEEAVIASTPLVPAAANGRHEANGRFEWPEPGRNGTAAEPVWAPPLPLSEMPPTVPFPLDVFPPPVRRFVEEIAWATSTPPDFAAVPVLTVAGAAIGNARFLSITRSHSQPPRLFTVIVGRPGTKKSPVLDLVKAPLERAEARHYHAWEQLVTSWEERGEQGAKPKMRRGLVDDFTMEDLIRILSENPRGVMAVKDELAGLVDALNQYKSGGKGNDRQILLSLWNGSSVCVDRRKNEGVPLRVRRPFAAITGAIQPGVVEKLRQSAAAQGVPVEDGFLDRFLPAYPDPIPATRELWREVSAASKGDWQDVVDRLLNLDPVEETDGPRPLFLPLDHDGRAAWEAFTQVQADELNSDELSDHLQGVWSKLTGTCGRIALILRCLREACGEDLGNVVGGQDVTAAAELIRYFKAHIRRVSAAMDLDPAVADAKRLLAWIQREAVERFKLWEAHKDVRSKGRFPNAAALLPGLNLLVEHDYLKEVAPEARAGPGRREGATYLVNPLGSSGQSG